MRIELFHIQHAIIRAIRVGRLSYLISNLIGGFFQLVVIIQPQFQSTHLIRLPFVQAVHHTQVGKQEQIIVFGKVGLINAHHRQTTCTHIILYIICIYLITKLQLHFVGDHLRDNNPISRSRITELRKFPLHQMTAKKRSGIFRTYALQHHPLKGISCLYHTRFGGITLYMLHFRIIRKDSNHAVRHSYGASFKGACRIRIANLNMGTETYYFITHLTLEPDYHRHCNNHYSQPDSNTKSCYQHSRAGNFLRITVTINTKSKETR